jgi:hypothetical protein
MKRRDFIAGIGAAAWPLVVRGQQATMPTVARGSCSRQKAAVAL